jgi:ribosome-binding protein aMBF1 (putative translation factor)
MGCDGNGSLAVDAERLVALVRGLPPGEFAAIFRRRLSPAGLLRLVAALPTNRRDQLIERARQAGKPPSAATRPPLVCRSDRPIATAIRTARQLAGRSQAQLAQLLGVRQSCVSQWEHGQTEPSAEHLVDLLRVLPGLREQLDAAAAQPADPQSSAVL